MFRFEERLLKLGVLYEILYTNKDVGSLRNSILISKKNLEKREKSERGLSSIHQICMAFSFLSLFTVPVLLT